MVNFFFKKFLQLSSSNVLLYLEDKLLLCEPKFEFKKVAGGKALATDYRDLPVFISHLAKAPKSFCTTWQSAGLFIQRYRKQSSANNLIVDEIHKGRSLT